MATLRVGDKVVGYDDWIASHVARGVLVKLDDATHALTTTHAEAVATLIADLAGRCARLGRRAE